MSRLHIQRGLSLIELMISLTLGLLVLIAIGSLFLQSQRSYRQNDLRAGLQDQARYALAELSRELAMAGYWGGVYGADVIAPNPADANPLNDATSASVGLPPSLDCGAAADQPWALLAQPRLEFHDQTDATAVEDRWRCIGDWRPGTDVVALRRVSAQTAARYEAGAASVSLLPHHFYLQTNATQGSLIRWPGVAAGLPAATDEPLLPPMRFHRYLPRIYFIRNHLRQAGDGIPSLCRKTLCDSGFSGAADPEQARCEGGAASAAGIYSECIAEGVEDLQLSWGLDSDGDDAVDRYTDTPSPQELREQVVLVQLHLRVRSREGDPAHLDRHRYELGNAVPFEPLAVDDGDLPAAQQARHQYRRVYSTTIKLQNPVHGLPP
ncbi:MAG TPA: PilW family protein [Nevskiaceae bacterium]|nr:PilW family protein [Nevskiaceae bacterium]